MRSLGATHFDLQLNGYYMQPDIAGAAAAPYQFLYPNSFDCLIIVVPNLHRTTSILLRLLHNGEVLAILLVFTTFLVLNILIKWSNGGRDMATHGFQTFGVCMAQSRVRVTNRREMLWTVGVLVFSLTSTATLSAVVYRKLMINQSWEPIRTMDDLAQSELTIYVADWFFDIGLRYDMME